VETEQMSTNPTNEYRSSVLDRIAATGPTYADLPALCRELLAQSRHVEERIILCEAFIDVVHHIGWTTPVGRILQEYFHEIDEWVIQDLADQLRSSDDPGQAKRCYERLRARCTEYDERVAFLAAEHPHIPGTAVIEEFPGVAAVMFPPPLFRKLEREAAWRTLDEALDRAAGEGRVDEALSALERPAAHVERTLARIERGDADPPTWFWHTTLAIEHFDVVRSALPWKTVIGRVDAATWDHIAEHVKTALEHDPERLTTFSALSEDFHGTLDELVRAAQDL
jgi:hypothetical protein